MTPIQDIVAVAQFVAKNYQAIISGVVMILTGMIGIALLVPGEQPEKGLQSAVDFLSKFSAKPKDSKVD